MAPEHLELCFHHSSTSGRAPVLGPRVPRICVSVLPIGFGRLTMQIGACGCGSCHRERDLRSPLFFFGLLCRVSSLDPERRERLLHDALCLHDTLVRLWSTSLGMSAVCRQMFCKATMADIILLSAEAFVFSSPFPAPFLDFRAKPALGACPALLGSLQLDMLVQGW